MKRGLLIMLKIVRVVLIVFLCLEGLIFVGGFVFNICYPNEKEFSQLDFIYLAIGLGVTFLLFGFVTLLIRKVLMPCKKNVVSKKFCIVSGIIVVLALLFYFVDKNILMKERVFRCQEWNYRSGNEIRGRTINLQNLYFRGDTMIFNYKIIETDRDNVSLLVKKNDSGGYRTEKIVNGISVERMSLNDKKDTTYYEYVNKGTDTLIFKWQYFNTMKIMDPKTKKTGKYSIK